MVVMVESVATRLGGATEGRRSNRHEARPRIVVVFVLNEVHHGVGQTTSSRKRNRNYAASFSRSTSFDVPVVVRSGQLNEVDRVAPLAANSGGHGAGWQREQPCRADHAGAHEIQHVRWLHLLKGVRA